MCCGIFKCQRTITVSLAIILSFDNTVNEPWYFVITVLFEKVCFSPLACSFISVVGSVIWFSL